MSLLYPAIIYYASRNKKPCSAKVGGNCSNISVVIASYNEPLDLLEEMLRSILSLQCKPGEIVVAWDCGDKEAIEAILEKILGGNVDYKLVYSSKPRGKARALIDAVKVSTKQYILVLDIDDRPGTSDYFSKLAIDPGAIGIWRPRTNSNSMLSEAIAATMLYASEVLYASRCRLGLPVLFLGSGTSINKSVLRSLGYWDTRSILEDIELGIRLAINGYKLNLLEDTPTIIGLPPSYTALRKQQCKWSKGAGELLRRKLSLILFSRELNLPIKLDLIVYLAQYLLSSLWLILLPLSILLGVGNNILADVLALYILAATTINAKTLTELLRREGFSWIKALRVSGGAAAISTTMALSLLVCSLEGVFGIKSKASKTPKYREKVGFHELALEIAYAALSLSAAAVSILQGLVLVPFLLIMVGVAPFYTIARYHREL